MKTKLIIEVKKPRNKHLNDVLLSCSSGKMKNHKDFSRLQEKKNLYKELKNVLY